jgi:hypothetical protein
MKLTVKADLEAPVEFLHASLCDTATWEREAIRRGIEIERPADMALSGVGAGWKIGLTFRGRVRKVLLRIDGIVQDQSIDYFFEGEAFVGTSQIETKALSPRRSRLRATIDVRPKTLAARLFLNTLRLARGRVEARLEQRLIKFAAQIADRYARERA